MTPFTFRNDGLTFHGLTCGAGRPMVLLHGGGSRGSTFAELMPLLAPSFQMWAYDQRGFGSTGAGPTDVISHAAWADDVRACLDHIGAANAIVCGWSLGAAVALNAASQWPRRIAALVLLGAPRPDRPINRKTFERRLELIAKGATAADVVAATFEATANGLGAWARAHRPAAVERIRHEHLAQDVALASRVVDAYCSRPDLMAVVPKVSCPVHLIVGADDRMCDLDGARVLAGELAHADITVIPDCGHYYAVEQPEAVARAILNALAGSARSDSRPGR
jgi:pimeloyl-ACP methyl ester carboxylesterase